MPWNIGDYLAGGTTITGATGPAPAVKKWYENPFLWDIVGSMGQGLQERGVEGLFPGAAGAFGRKQYATAAAKEQQRRQQFMDAFFKLAGGFSPGEQPGITSMKMGPKGNLLFDVTPPGEEEETAGLGGMRRGKFGGMVQDIFSPGNF